MSVLALVSQTRSGIMCRTACFSLLGRRRLIIKLTAGRDICGLQLHRMQCWSSWHVKTKSYVRLTISIYHYCIINRYLGMSCKMTRQTLRRNQLSYHQIEMELASVGICKLALSSFSAKQMCWDQESVQHFLWQGHYIFIFLWTRDHYKTRDPKIYGFYFWSLV